MNTSQIIENALRLSNNKPISELEIAKLMNFNEEEIQMIKFFWNPIFN